MSQTEITVRGRFTASRAPERGTVHARVELEGPEPEQVYAAVADRTRAVTAAVTDLHDEEHGPVTWYSVQDVRTWAVRPWNQEGRQLPLVHHAAAQVQVRFSDFGALSAWLRAQAALDGFRTDHVEWTLTEGHERTLTEEVRAAAVLDARDKAQAYADALGLGPVRVLALADAGMLGTGPHPSYGGGEPYAAAAMRAEASGGGVELVPGDIEVTAEVDARFVAG